jgi:dipeptidase E
VRLLLLSNAKREGMGYLEHARGYFQAFLGEAVREVLFVPYAAVTKSHDQFVDQVRPVFESLRVGVSGIHAARDPREAVRNAQAIVVGGGSTWRLMRELRLAELLPVIRNRVVAGMPYAGWSAGSNIACPTIMTTNDMPICDPGGFDALALVPFQINPHYLHGNPPGFKGETREERINEFGVLHPRSWVAGLREGTGFLVEDGAITLLGEAQCRIFRHGDTPRELGADDDFGFLLKPD